MSNKNPFEIRQEILQMAKDYMDQQWHMNVDFTRQLVEQNKATVEQMQDALKPYTIETLMEKAQELYTFVSKKD
jgi:hypothetical protein